jgi:intein/homing endonuclease
LRSGGRVRVERIGEVVDRYFTPDAEGKAFVTGMEVVAFDPSTLVVGWRPIQYVYRHRRRGKLLSFKLQTGRRCLVTLDHSLFVLREGTIRAEPASEIRPGDFVVGSKTIPSSAGGRAVINLFELLPEQKSARKPKLKKFEDFYLYNVPKEAFERISNRKEGQWNDWKRKSMLPIRYTASLTEAEKEVVTLGYHSQAAHLRPLIDVDDDIARLLGYYVAEGHVSKSQRTFRVEFTFGAQDQEIIEDTISILRRKFGSSATKRQHGEKGVRVSVNHRILCEFFERLAGTGAGEKRLPTVILNSPASVRHAFITAWVKGDFGVTVSKQLANDVSYLLLMDSCLSTISERKGSCAYLKGRFIVGTGCYDLKFPRPERIISDSDWPGRKRAKDEPTPPASELPNPLKYFYKTTATLQNLNGRVTDRVLRTLEMRIAAMMELSGTRVRNKERNQRDGLYRCNLKYFVKRNGRIFAGEVLQKAVRDLNLARKVTRSDLAFLRVISIEEAEPTSEYVYDVSVPGCENFLAGFGGVFCHNTGSGKTTIARLVAKGLEEANTNGQFPSSFIYVDVKGDDAWKFLAQSEKLDPSKLTFLDPNETGFSINPFELPNHDAGDAERVKSVYTGFVMRVIEEWYGADPSRAPRMLRIFRSLISFLYTITDAPTFVDLHALVVGLQSGDENVLKEVKEVLGRTEFESLNKELDAIAEMRSEAFDPVLTRLSEFAVDPYLRRLFGGVRHSSVDFTELLRPGRQTIIRVPSHEVGLHIGPLIQSVILLKLWFAVLWRSTRTKEQERTPLILVLDEFQELQRLQAIQTILSQARSQGLCLILSHQTTAQLDDTLLKIVISNAAIQGAGRVSGDDASRLARAWDPQFEKEIKQALVTQPDFTWTFRLRADPGEEQGPPVQEKLLKPPEEKHSDAEIQAFCVTMKDLYGADRTDKSVFEKEKETTPEWARFLLPDQPFPTKEVWRLLVAEEAPPRLRISSR